MNDGPGSTVYRRMTMLERPLSLTELTTRSIRDQIVNGDIELGAVLSESRLAKQLGVSRTPVREALNRLEIEGLVRTEPQHGSIVFALGSGELSQICDVRVCLETTALQLAIEHDLAALCNALNAIIERMDAALSADQISAYLQEDTRFHDALVDGAGNPFLKSAYAPIALKMAALRNRLGRHPDHIAKSFAEHRAFLAAIVGGNAPEADRILRYHIDRKEGSYWALLAEM